ncbi:MAG: hypothetical protein ACLSHL_15525 [Alistipes communis]
MRRSNVPGKATDDCPPSVSVTEVMCTLRMSVVSKSGRMTVCCAALIWAAPSSPSASIASMLIVTTG